MPGLVVTIDVDHTKPMVVKDHQNNTAKIVPVNPQSPLSTPGGKSIVAMQTVTIIWSKSSADTVCYVIGGNMYCFP